MKLLKNKIVIISLLAIFGIVAGLCYWVWFTEFRPAFSVEESQNAYLYVYPNMTLSDVCKEFEQGGFTKNANHFKWYMKRKNYTERIKVGRYKISDGMTNRTLAQHLIFGMQEPVKLRFNNIRLPQELAARLDKQLLLDSAEIMQKFNDADFLSKYDLKPETAIALFIPNTYEVYWDISAKGLFDRMHREYNAFWTQARREKAKTAKLSPIEVAILASIVEEETNVASDKSIVAGLYLNRLHRGWPLQADPTVRFALGDFTITRVLDEHTEINSPYNTYKYRDLPPGPIRMASIAGIDTVLNYTKSNYLYMCASEKMDGSHNFAASLAEHNRNAQKYRRAYRAWNKQRKTQNQ